MACDPKLLIADEPTTALDVTVQKEVLDLMGDLQTRTGTAIVLISHDLGVIAETCDKVAGHVSWKDRGSRRKRLNCSET